MRKEFSDTLLGVDDSVNKIFSELDFALHEAVEALLTGNLDKAEEARKVAINCFEQTNQLQDDIYDIICLQSPVASDLRFLQSVVYITFNFERIARNSRDIAKATAKLSSGHLPSSIADLISAEAQLVFRVMETVRKAYEEKDLSLVVQLPSLDEPVDALYKQFFREVANLPMSDDKELIGSRIIMVSRYLERISDNCVIAGERIVFMLTHKRTSIYEIAQYTDEQLKAFYAIVPSTDAVIVVPDAGESDAQ